MKRILNASMVIILVLLCNLAFAQQEKTINYYINHEDEILTDAQVAFQSGEYDRVVELCKWHYVIVGDERAEQLRGTAERCTSLTGEMVELVSQGKNKEAAERAKELLKINPNDEAAQKVIQDAVNSLEPVAPQVPVAPDRSVTDGKEADTEPEATVQSPSKEPVEQENALSSGEWRSLFTEVFLDGAKEMAEGLYKGQWSNSTKSPNGYGALLAYDGSAYVGEWKDGKRNGYGIHLSLSSTFDSYPYSSGFWKNNLRDGVCHGFDAAGNIVFSSRFVAGKRDELMDNVLKGYANIRFACIEQGDGDLFVGETRNGVPDGYGMLLNPDGVCWYGEWNKGKKTNNGKSLVMGRKESILGGLMDKASSALEGMVSTITNNGTSDYPKPKDKRATEFLDSMPSFQGGGTDKFAAWVSSNLEYPVEDRLNHIEGTVKLSFTIDNRGRVTNVSVISGVSASLDAEAVRVVKSSPLWTPGMVNNTPVPVTFSFPVIFSLYEGEE